MTDAFDAYKADPTTDNLIRLLRAHQDRIYRVCFQVLRRAHDAEDAAQEALIRIAQGAPAVDDADAFRRWTYRVALNSALEAARKAARRRAHEARTPMKEPPPAPLDEESRRALFEAVERLDDRTRDVLLDHYVEGETLESIGARAGVTPQAVSKRLERAKEELKKALPAVLLAWPEFGRLFDRSAIVSPPDLVSGHVLAKVATLGGGAAMAAKSSIPVAALAAFLLLFSAVAVVAVLRRSESPDAGGPTTGAKSAPSSTATPNHATSPSGELTVASGDSPKANAEEPGTSVTPLRTRLDRFKKWWDGIQADQTLARADGEKWGAFQKRWDKELWDHVAGLRELILQDPDGFLAFLRDPDNARVLGDLTRHNLITLTERPWVEMHLGFDTYPPVLMKGLFEIVQSGDSAQKLGALNLLRGIPDVPAEFKNAYLVLLNDPDPGVQRQVIGFIPYILPMTAELFPRLSALGNNSDNLFIRLSVVTTMAGVQSREAETFVLHRLAVATHDNELFQIPFSLESRYRGARASGQPILEAELARAVSESMARNHEDYVLRLMPVATFLPADRLKPILQQGMVRTRYDWYRERLAKALERVDAGSYTRDDLMKILEPPR